MKKQTIYLENKESWLCKSCSTINQNNFDRCNYCNSIKGVFVVIVRPRKFITHKEWDQLKRFKETDVDDVIFYSDLQMIMCQKYDIRITDWLPKWTRRWRTFKKYVNMKNLNKGIDTFNKGVNQFTGSLDSMTDELGGKKSRSSQGNANVNKLVGNKKSSTSIWGKKRKEKRNTIPIWKERKEKKERRGRRRRSRSRDEENVDKIWGKRR